MMPPAVVRQFIAGEWVDGQGAAQVVLDKYTLEPFATLAEAGADQLAQAVDAAQAAFLRGAPAPHERGAILERAADAVAAAQEEFVGVMQREAGFTRGDALGEARRSVQTLKLCAEEARRLVGDVLPLEAWAGRRAAWRFTLRVPLGIVLAVTPFNAPLNTVIHKVGPAFAAGNAVILKPSLHTPMTACLLARVLHEAGLPRGLLGVVHGGGETVRRLQDDARIRFIAFTGSTEVGPIIQQQGGCGARRWNSARSPARSCATTPTSKPRCRRW